MTTRRMVGLALASLILFLLGPGPRVDSERFTPLGRIDDDAFWRMFSEFSEPGGDFHSDNLVSNERGFPAVAAQIAGLPSAASAYVGVGPEQNFSYLAALGPRMAFIVDIRRENAILHLFYKALFELSASRAEFLSRLFSRPRPRHLGPASQARELLEAFAIVPSSLDLYTANLREVRAQLLEVHGFGLGAEDLTALEHVSAAFFEAGPDLRYSLRGFRRPRPFPSYAELMSATDDLGVARSYLASEPGYQVVRALQQNNLVIPVVGDFAGGKALRAVGTRLRTLGLTVTAFYASNVENYLFRRGDWRRFYENLGDLPLDRRSVLIRFAPRGFGMYRSGPGFDGGLVLDPITGLVAAFRRGAITNYGDLLFRPR